MALFPSNIGLDGTIGGECGGRWYGGAYGWGFSTIVPQTGETAHRPYFLIRAHWSFGNGLLLTGDQKYVDTWRGVIDGVNANSKVEDGQTLYPRMHGDDGWYDYRPEPFDVGAEQVYYWSMDRRDLERVPMEGWIAFLEGQNPGLSGGGAAGGRLDRSLEDGKDANRPVLTGYASIGRHERHESRGGGRSDPAHARRNAHRAPGPPPALPFQVLRSRAPAPRDAGRRGRPRGRASR